jgi:putative hydrolase of the HAD superfamily
LFLFLLNFLNIGIVHCFRLWKRGGMKYFLFDIGNVLANFDYQDLLVAYANGGEVMPLSKSDLEIYDRVECGEVSDEEYVDYLNSVKGLDWTRDDLVALWRRMFSPNEAGRSLFSSAVQSGVGVYTLSNISSYHMEAIERNWNDFFAGATGLFLSYEIGVRKPHPDIYRHALDTLGVDGDQCFFVDDLPENIEAARELGIHAHRFVPENHVAIEQAAAQFFSWA